MKELLLIGLRRKDQAVKYWIQAAKLGHESAADKLLMAQMRR